MSHDRQSDQPKDEDIAFKIVIKNPKKISDFIGIVEYPERFLERLVKYDGNILEHIPIKWQSQPVVLDALKKNGNAIQHVKIKQLLETQEIFLTAIAQCNATYQSHNHVASVCSLLPASLKNDKEIVRKALEKDWRALEFLEKTPENIFKALKESSDSIKNAKLEKRIDITGELMVLDHVPKCFLSVQENVVTIININPAFFLKLPYHLREDCEMAINVVRLNPDMLQHISQTVKDKIHDPKFIQEKLFEEIIKGGYTNIEDDIKRKVIPVIRSINHNPIFDKERLFIEFAQMKDVKDMMDIKDLKQYLIDEVKKQYKAHLTQIERSALHDLGGSQEPTSSPGSNDTKGKGRGGYPQQ